MPNASPFAYRAPVRLQRREARARVMRRIGWPLAALLLTVPLVPVEDGRPASAAAGVPRSALLGGLAPGLQPAALTDEITPANASASVGAPPFVAAYGDAASALRAETCLTEAIYYEGALEPEAGQRAIAQVVLNRVRHPAYPDTVCGVVFQGQERSTGCQFTFTCDGSRARAPVPSLWRRANQVARAALGGSVAAEVGLATHYHADYVLPYWSASLSPAGQIGRHVFYRWRSRAGEAAAFTARYAGREPVIAAWTARPAGPAPSAGAAAPGGGAMPGLASGATTIASASDATQPVLTLAPAPAPAPTFKARPLMLAAKTVDATP